MLQRVLLLLTILFAALWLGNTVMEGFGGTSPGTLLQLAADKGGYGGYGYYGFPGSLPYGRALRDGYYRYGYPRGNYGYYGYGLYPTYSGYKYGYLSAGYPYYGGY